MAASLTPCVLQSEFLLSRNAVSKKCSLTQAVSLPELRQQRKQKSVTCKVSTNELSRAILKSLPAVSIAAAVAAFSTGAAIAADGTVPDFPVVEIQASRDLSASGLQGTSLSAPPVQAKKVELPEGNQWRYSEFLNAVKSGKVERVRFAKDGSSLQVCLFLPTERLELRITPLPHLVFFPNPSLQQLMVEEQQLLFLTTLNL